MSDWISVKESGYPEDDVRVLVYDVEGVHGGHQIDIEYREGEFWHEGGVYSSITHWMPLPAPPRTDTNSFNSMDELFKDLGI